MRSISATHTCCRTPAAAARRRLAAGGASPPRPLLLPSSPARRAAAAPRAVASAATTGQQLALHLGDTTVHVPFSPEQARTLDAALSGLLQTFADKQAAKRPKRWESMEVRFAGPVAGEGLELLELFCNPNAHNTAFDAKLLVTIKAAGGLQLASEGRLSAIKADVDAFMLEIDGA